MLLAIKDDDKANIAAQFAIKPRSREAARLERDVYKDNETGYIGILNDASGVVVARGLSFDTQDRLPVESLILSWAALHRRIAELVDADRFYNINEP
jgi:hypothetical protein